LPRKRTSIGNFIPKVWINLQGLSSSASPGGKSALPKRPFILDKAEFALTTVSAIDFPLLALRAFILLRAGNQLFFMSQPDINKRELDRYHYKNHSIAF
jgi:hypothetical protein